MRPFPGAVLACALAVLAVVPCAARAAWNNVFQVCCNCSSHYAPAVDACCPQPCPQTTCTTRYVQRCYYQPVTTYRTRTYYQQVTTYRTSYYYEPVTSYRYCCYYDPCTCSYQQVAKPVTSYRLRSRCCPVTSYLQRTCLQPTTPAPACPPTPSAPSVTEQPGTAAPPTNPPSVSEDPGLPPAGSGMGNGYKSRRPPQPPGMPPATEGRYQRSPRLYAPVPVPPSPKPKPKVRPERFASRYSAEGKVLSADRVPQSNARVVFVRADKGGRQTATTDVRGQFRVHLASGRWLVYVQGNDGRPVFNRQLDVGTGEPVRLTLTSR
jgi:hypothetical protein